jgi:Rha family phage regulatory protein
MNDLQVINYENRLMVDSREVSKMVDKPHDQLMRSIRTYVEYLDSAKMQSRDFFIESTYINSQKKEQPCYLISKKGCDLIANKMTGEKGVRFTAAYVTRFEEMENQLRKPTSIEDILIASLQSMKAIKIKQAEHDEDIKLLKAKIENHPKDFFSIIGYASLRGLRIDGSKANLLGRKASQISRDYEVDIGKVTDPRFGQVNTYHLDVLKEVFK